MVLRAIAGILVLATTAIVASAALAAGPGKGQVLPPGGIYTCAWIAAHPTEATLARVSCNSDMVNPGSSVSPAEVAAADLANASSPSTILGSGCPRVPSSGAIGQGVWARTAGDYYSSFWEWPAGSQNGYYTWYIKRTSDDATINWGSQFAGDFEYVASNVHYWKVQNHHNIAQFWNCVFWSG